MNLVITPNVRRAIGAVEAFPLAGITYRQLDYWAARGWVKPSIEPGSGRPGRRLYSPNDVLRLATLGHMGRSGADVGQLGPQMAELKLPTDAADYLVVLEPDLSLRVVTAADLRDHVAIPGSYVVFDPAPLRRQLGLCPALAAGDTRLNEARTA
jgi:DNA-binding transcriptional MerR regulator